MDCAVGLAGVQDKDLVGTAVVGRIGNAQERMARNCGRIHEGSLLACNTWQNTEHEELIDANSTRVGCRTCRPNRLQSGLKRLVSPRHTAGPAHLQQNGPQTDHRRGGKKTERWKKSTPHRETTKPPALGGRGRLERNSRKTLMQKEHRKLRTHGQRREEKQHWNAGKTRDAQDPELLAVMGRKEKRHSFQNHRQTDLVETQIPENRCRRKTLKQTEQDGRAPPGVGTVRNHSGATT